MKVIRSILRENFRRHIKCELPLEKTCKDRLVPLKNRVPATAKLGKKHVLKVKNRAWTPELAEGSQLLPMTVVCHCQIHTSHFFRVCGEWEGGRVFPHLGAWQRVRRDKPAYHPHTLYFHIWCVISSLKSRLNKAQINFAGKKQTPFGMQY